MYPAFKCKSDYNFVIIGNCVPGINANLIKNDFYLQFIFIAEFDHL